MNELPEHIEGSTQQDAKRSLRLAAVCTLIIALAGAATIPMIAPRGLGLVSLFYEQYARIEGPALALVAAFAIAVLLLNRRAVEADDAVLDEPSSRTSRLVLWGAIAFAAIVIIAGYHLAFDQYFLADDEYAAWFQTLIFAGGRTTAVVPPAWCRWSGAMVPTSIAVPAPCSWKLSFLPLHSLFRSAFVALHADFLAGPVTAALTIGLVAATARRLWPEAPRRAVVAVLVLASSMQLLFTSMTMYSMPTHLLVSALWLWLFVVGEVWAIALLPVVGFVAFGVHSPIPHGLWVAPFILRFLWRRQWLAFGYVSLGYAISLAYWSHWFGIGGAGVAGLPIATAMGTMQAIRTPFGIPRALDQMTTAMHISLIATWNSPLVMTCLLLAVLTWRGLNATCRDMVLSLLLIVLARTFVRSPQGEGWGYRYVYDALSNIALLAAVGMDVLARALGRRRAMGLALASLAASVFIQLPMRTLNVRGIVVPYARTYHWMASLPVQVVVFNAEDVMWGRQMLRNDPYLAARPVLMEVHGLPKDGLQELQTAFPGQVRVVTQNELRQFGAPAAPIRFGGFMTPP